jgi:hypothetical protein
MAIADKPQSHARVHEDAPVGRDDQTAKPPNPQRFGPDDLNMHDGPRFF